MPISNSKNVTTKGMSKAHPELLDLTKGLRIHFRAHVQSCMRRGLSSTLSVEQFVSITSKRCHFCDCEPELRAWKDCAPFRASGVDRLDNRKGYIEGNVVPCCSVCNSMKSDRNAVGFIEHCRRVTAYRG